MSQINPQIEALAIDRTEQPPNHAKVKVLLVTVALSLITGFVLFTNQNGRAEAVSSTQTISQLASQKNSQIAINPVQKTQNLELNSKRVLDASGHIVARRIATVSSQVTGKVELLNIEEGQLVLKDEILAELDDLQAKITLQLTLAELASNKATGEALSIAYQNELKLYARRKALAEKHLLSDELLEKSLSKTEQMAAQLKNQAALINLVEQKVAMASYLLSQHKIRAPFEGVVISKNAQVGELISAGTSGGGSIRTGVGTIVDMDSLEIEVEVGESYINRVYAGQQVEARLDAYPQWLIKSEVVTIIPTADRQKASIRVRIKLLEMDTKILPDMSVKVSFLS